MVRISSVGRDFCSCRYDRITGKRILCPYHTLNKKPPWQPKRPRYYHIPIENIMSMGKGIQEDKVRGLFYLTYLCGSRISETVQFKPQHITITPEFYKIMMIVLKKKRADQMLRTVLIPRPPKAKCFEQEIMDDILHILKGSPPDSQPFWFGTHNPKRPGHYSSNKLRRAIKLSTEALVNSGGTWMPKAIEKPLHPHYLRHVRARHLYVYYKFSDIKLRLFFAWSDTKMAKNYVDQIELEDAF